ncbi:MAG: hypothetical protein R3B72_43180 [Polyangiaceae bacterium]
MIQPQAHFSPAVSLVAVLGFMLAVPLLLMLAQQLVSIWHRRRAEREAAAQQGDPLAPGPSVLYGQVRFAPGAPLALRTTITQLGTEQKNKGVWSHRWTEVERAVEAEPFYLELSGGRNVRVESSADVLQVDEVDRTELMNDKQRRRVAELGEGEAIYAVGELVWGHDPRAAGDYRGTGQSLVLREPARGRMLLSSKPLGDRFRQRASFHRGWLIGQIVLVLFFQLLAVPYYARLGWGVPGEGTVTDKRHFTTSSKSGTVDHWELTITTDRGRTFTDEVSSGHYFSLVRGSRVPVIEVPWWEGRERVGHGVTIALGLPMTFFILWLLYAIGYVVVTRTSRPWWERKLVETGQGRLVAE